MNQAICSSLLSVTVILCIAITVSCNQTPHENFTTAAQEQDCLEAHYIDPNNPDKYYLVVKKFTDSTLYYHLTVRESDTHIIHLSDTLPTTRSHTSIQEKYGIYWSGEKFTYEGPKVKATLTFDSKNYDYASFIYKFVDWKNPDESKYNGYKVNTPTLIRIGMEEPYFDNVEHVIQKIGNIKSRLLEDNADRQVNALNEKYRYWSNSLYELLKRINKERRIIELDNDRLKYMVRYYEMDTVEQVLETYGINRLSESDPVKDYVFSYDSLGHLVGSVRTDYTRKMLWGTFEELYHRGEYNHDHNQWHYGQSPLFSDRRRVYTFGDYTLVVFHDGGFESVGHLITQWESYNNKYRLKTILDHELKVAIGGVELDTLINLSSDRRFLIGRTLGGDAGDMWGSTWIGLWTDEKSFRIVYEQEIRGSEGYEEQIEYNISPELKMNLQLFLKIRNDKEEMDSLISTQTIDLNELID